MSALRPIDRWFIDQVLPHEASFLQVARRLERDPDAANDLVQEAYLKLYGMEGWASIANPRHYVLRMLRNMAIERLRRARIVEFQRISDIEDGEGARAPVLSQDSPIGSVTANGGFRFSHYDISGADKVWTYLGGPVRRRLRPHLRRSPPAAQDRRRAA